MAERGKNNLKRCYIVDTKAAHGEDAVSTGKKKKKLGQSQSVVAFACSFSVFERWQAISIALLLIPFDTVFFEGSEQARKNVWQA